MIKVDIQMYYSDLIQAYVNKEKFERDIKNVELGYTIYVEVVDIKGIRIKFNPKYVAYIKYSNGVEDENTL